jgi:hypothetical protein
MQPALETQAMLLQRGQQWEQVKQQHAAGKRVIVDDHARMLMGGKEVYGDASDGGGAE